MRIASRSIAKRRGAAIHRVESLGAGALAFVAIALASGLRRTPYDNYVLLADAFRHGRVWIDWPGPAIDALHYAGRYYVIEAPFPAILLLPAVLLRGTGVNQTLLAALLGGVSVFAAYDVARRLDVPRRTTVLLCAFLLLGTDLFWSAMLGDVWFIAHVASVACTLLALRELLGARRAWLVALFAAFAVESRFSLVLALPVYAAMLWFGTGSAATPDDDEATRRRRVAAFVVTLVPFVALWVWYNELRWGGPFDIGYNAWFHQDAAGSPSGSPFRLEYLPKQLYAFFVRFPNWQATYPFLVPTILGVALPWTSPALALAFFARHPMRLIVAMWAAVALTAAPNFVYYVDGFAQFGMRHALDFEPYLYVLMALAVSRRGIGRLGTVLCVYSIAVGIWGCWFWRAFFRP